MKTRILEINSCSECPHFDDRWDYPPWDCNLEPALAIQFKGTIPEDCPLPAKADLKRSCRKPARKPNK